MPISEVSNSTKVVIKSRTLFNRIRNINNNINNISINKIVTTEGSKIKVNI